MARDLEVDIEAAERHVVEARRIVEEQADRLSGLRECGADTSDAERRLRVFQCNLRVFEGHLVV